MKSLTLDFDGQDFGHIQELAVFMDKVQRLCNIEDGHLYGSPKGIAYQFRQLNVPEEERHRDEVMVVYFVPDFEPDVPELNPRKQWFSKTTKKAVQEPEWFKERKEKLEKALKEKGN